MKNKRKHKRLFSVVAVFVVSVVLLLCSSVSAFALPIVKPVTYNGANWVSVSNVPGLRFYFAGKTAAYDTYNIPVQKQIIGNGKGLPQYTYVDFGAYFNPENDQRLPVKSGESYKFYVRYWANVYLSSSPQTPVFNYQATDVNIVYSDPLGENVQRASFKSKADTSYPSTGSPLPHVCEFTFTNPSSETVYIEGVEMGDVNGDNTWPSGEQRDTYAGFFNINRIYYRLITPQEAANDELLHGWTPKPQKPAGSGTVDSTNKLEEQIGENAQEGIDESNKLFNGFGGTLEILSSGLIFVTGLFNTMIDKMSFFESLAIIGLVLGIIGFILNLVPSIGSGLSRADRDRERKEKARAREEKARAKRVAGKNHNNIGNKIRKH